MPPATSLGSVALYDRILAEKPGDGRAHVGRAAPQRRRSARSSPPLTPRGSPEIPSLALDQLRRLFELRRDWQIGPPPPVARALATELAAATEYVATSVGRALQTGPFAAEAALARHATMLDLAELGHRRAELAATIHTAGLASCTQLAGSTSATMPYWTWLVDRVCAHWDARIPSSRCCLTSSPGSTSLARSTVRTATRTRSSVTPSTPRSAPASGTGLRRPAWSGPRSPARCRHALGAAGPADRGVDRVGPVHRLRDEPGVVSGALRRYRVVLRSSPHTDSDGTTSYRSEHKSRTVTKYRTAYRSVTNPVTKYRDESRTFEYEATHREGHYASTLRVEFDGTLRDLVPSIASDFGATGIDHDVTHCPPVSRPGAPAS